MEKPKEEFDIFGNFRAHVQVRRCLPLQSHFCKKARLPKCQNHSFKQNSASCDFELDRVSE